MVGNLFSSILPVVFVLGIVFFIANAVQKWRQERRALDEIYREVAQHYYGTAFANTLQQPASAKFVSHGAHVTVDSWSRSRASRSRNRECYVQCHIRYPDLQLRLEISPSSPLKSLGKYIGMQDIEIGDTRFDADYIIGGNSHVSICRLLNAQVLSSIDRLRKLFEQDDIHVAIRGGILLNLRLGCECAPKISLL